MKIEFDDRFEERILYRGYEYYKNEAVQDVHEVEDVIVAKIIGSKNYEAYVQIEDDELIEAGCSCPYAAEGRYCKHIAALLYYLEENDIDSNSKKYKDKRTKLLNTVKKIDKKELENYLVDLLEDNEEVYDRFRMRFSNIFTPLPLNEYKRKIREAIRKSAGRDGFIDYEESWDYTHEMYKITNEANRLVENEYYDLAFDVVSSILDTIPNTDIDDSNGSTGEVADSCIRIIEKILDKILYNDEKLSKKILQYILHELQTDSLSNYGIELYELLNLYIENDFFLDEIEKYLVSILKRSKSKDYFWHTKHYVEYLITIYDKENNHDKIINLLEEFSYDKDVCFKLVDEYLKQDEVKKAIELLKEKLDDTNGRFYAEKLAEIYYNKNMTNEYKETLYKLFYELNKYDIDIYKNIKNLYTEKEWLIEREKIIKSVPKDNNRYSNDILPIYIEEKMYDEIFEYVKGYNIDTITYYEKYLLPKYNKELIDIYTNYCRNFAKRANNRKLYRQLASYLRHIKSMQNSKEHYQKLMLEIQEQYRNKPAMQDELRGL